ncbi:MAG TPA: hypothetical protein VLK23_20475 [Thermodesulfobacteriota bacterium]|nr:hypothetical protein [Thermodesulfobacteriota bacterium]
MWILLGAIFLTSFILISLEITFSRLLSVLLSYHYVFIVLSLALLGLGAGGIFVHLFRSRTLRGEDPFGVLALSTSFFSMFIPFSVIMLIQTGENLLLHGLLLFLPFFSAGLFFAGVYGLYPSLSSLTYGADLIGAAAGSLGAILALDFLGGLRVHFFLGAIASVAALALAINGKGRKGRIAALFSLIGTTLLLGTNLIGLYRPDMPIGKHPNKEIHEALSESSLKGRIIETQWTAFGRTDLVKYGEDPGHMDLYLDGTAGSPMYRFNGDPSRPDPPVQALKTTFPGYFPFLHLNESEKNHGLIIGPGGGRDVLLALMGGIRKITAVEVNRDLVEMVRRFSIYNGGIYTAFPNVKIVIDEGRHFLRRQKERYDMILLSLPVTNTSRSLEGFSLTENYLLTKDSIINYLDHLTDAGCLVVVGHNDAEILKLLSITLAALSVQGVDHRAAMNQIYITASKGLYNYLVFVLKKKAFEPGDSLLRYEAMLQLGLDPLSSYFPYIGEGKGLNPALISLSQGRMTIDQLEKRVEKSGYDIRPVTDDSPFFYKIEGGIPKPVSLAFWSSVILLFVVTGSPLLFWKGEMTRVRKPMALFTMLGVAFMVIEISLIQRFVLFLGQPVISMAILLFSLLGGAGLGSVWSGRLVRDKISRRIATASLTVGVMILCYLFLLPFIFEQLLGLSLLIRLLVTVLMLGPLGFLMGFPFPLGLRYLKETGMGNAIPWMWGINGVSSVFGSVITVVVAISFGFTGALLISVGCYLVIFLLFLKS